MEEAAEKTEISADVTALTSASDLSWAITGVGFHLFNALESEVFVSFSSAQFYCRWVLWQAC